MLVMVALAVALLVGSVATVRTGVDAAPVTPGFGLAIDPLAGYVGQTTCDPTAKPGTVALMNLLEATYPTTSSMGIERDCAAGGTSEHKEGRAYDWGVNAADPAQAAMAQDFLTWLLAPDVFGNKYAMARRLGIMYVIWNRMTWKAYAADKGWQPYSGTSPHTDHVHISLSWDGARGRTSWYEATKVVPVPGKGYWLPSVNGLTFSYAAPSYGSLTSVPALPVVGMAPTPTGKGYWHVASDGGIFAFGDAAFLGSTGGTRLNMPIVGMASTPTGKGYWLVASDGGIFAYGDAAFRGSTGAVALNKPIVAMASTGSGAGYWLVASDGGVFAYGNAAFRGSTGGRALVSPIRSMASTATDAGYWMVASDGDVFAFGDAPYQGSAASSGTTIVGIARYL